MTVYGDVYAFINALCDFTVLSVLAVVLRKRLSLPRQLLASALGGAFALLSLYITGAPLSLLSFFCSVGMVMLTFGIQSPKRFFLHLLCFYLVSALMGGLTELLLKGLNRVLSILPALLILTVLLALSALIVTVAGRAFLKRSAAPRADLFFTLAGEAHSLVALCDSGNLVTDPESGLPVIFLSHTLLKDPPSNAGSLRVSTVAGGSTLPLLRPETLRVNGEPCMALLALTDIGDFDGTDALIPNILLL